MAIKKILTLPNPILREKSAPVKEVNNKIKDILKDMLETMYNAPGIGLAAIQIGVPKRLVVMDISKEPEKKDPMFFVNPEIISKSEELSTYEEGCLSIPNQFAKIQRPNFCKVKFLDFNGEEKEIKAEGLLSTCIQHEVDHLNGILFIDYLSKLRKDMIVKKASKQKKDQERIVV
tara:strand:- start:381 stop:905 length:525 start_codon:yes stop_codon:yes gene_type:complete